MPTATKAGKEKKKQSSDITVETVGDEIHVSFGIRNYRVRGLEKNNSSQQLKVNVLARRDDLVHLDTLDLYRELGIDLCNSGS